jgi:RNA polymerase sigma factor (sigma-70 family)
VRDTEIAELVAAAAGGDQRAWSTLVRRYAGLVMATARAVRLVPEDVEEVSQVTWLLLATHIRGLRDPLAVAGWLVKTATREAVRLARQRRQQSRFSEELFDAPAQQAPPEEGILRDELREQVRRGFALLPERCQLLLAMLARDPPLTYREVSAALDMRVGSIGPVRARCLDRLKRAAGLAGN